MSKTNRTISQSDPNIIIEIKWNIINFENISITSEYIYTILEKSRQNYCNKQDIFITLSNAGCTTNNPMDNTSNELALSIMTQPFS